MVRDSETSTGSKMPKVKSMKDPIKLLGTLLSYNQNKNFDENFMNRIRKMKTKLLGILCYMVYLY